jgi:hypothetical protein
LISWISSGVIDGLLEKGKFRDELAPAGFEDAPLRVRERAEVRGRELVERAFKVVEARGDRSSGGAQRRGALRVLAREAAARIAQERLARRGVGGRAVGRQERLRLARGERVALDGPGQAQLLRGGKHRQSASRGEGQAPAVHARGELGRKPSREREARLDPVLLLAEELGDRGDRELVLVGERGDDARLVHGAGRLRGRVGRKQRRLHRRARDRLDHDGHLGSAFPSQQGQTLEAVEDLVVAVAGRGDAKRHRGERAWAVGALAAQRRERVPEARDGDDDHGVASGSGSSWYIGYR